MNDPSNPSEPPLTSNSASPNILTEQASIPEGVPHHDPVEREDDTITEILNTIPEGDNSKRTKSRWATPEQASFLESNIPAFLQAQSQGKLPCFWPILFKDWSARWSDRERLYPAPPGEEPPPLSPMALHDLQNAIEARQKVSQPKISRVLHEKDTLFIL